MSTRAAPPPIPADRLRRPRLAACVALHPPQGAAGSWILQRGESRYFRVSADIARLAGEFDGERDHEQLARALGEPWRPADVGTVVSRLAAGGLLDDGSSFARRRTSRWRIAPPLTVQFSVLHPGRALACARPVVAAALTRPARIGFAVVVLAGLIGLLAQRDDLRLALSSPLPLSTYLFVFLGILVTTGVHEIAHGAVLTYHGGRPSRLGVMLFYLSPAFFCDVSDGWRLPDRRDRVRIALAGVAVQVGIAGIASVAAALVALAKPGSSAQPALLLFAAATFLAGLFNLIPFIKLDGYIALMSHVDIPHLRQRAMVDGRRALARLLFGGADRRELPGRPWSTLFGLACMVFPVYVIAGALVIWSDLLAGFGFVGIGVTLGILLVLGCYVVRGGVRLIREGRAAGAARWRVALVCLGVAGVVGWALVGVRLPVTVEAGYVLAEDGTASLVSTSEFDPGTVAPGAAVTLYRAGLAGREHVGDAVIAPVPGPTDPSTGAPADGATGTAPLAAFLPVQNLPIDVPAHRVPLTLTARPAVPIGAASVAGPAEPLWQWLASTYFRPVVSW